jgi:hypothetical protein
MEVMIALKTYKQSAHLAIKLKLKKNVILPNKP